MSCYANTLLTRKDRLFCLEGGNIKYVISSVIIRIGMLRKRGWQ